MMAARWAGDMRRVRPARPLLRAARDGILLVLLFPGKRVSNTILLIVLCPGKRVSNTILLIVLCPGKRVSDRGILL